MDDLPPELLAQLSALPEEPPADFTKRESQIIGMMLKAERILPDDFWHVEAVQELACVLARYETVMTDAHITTVIGVGAMLARHGKAEMTAGMHATLALAKAREPRP